MRGVVLLAVITLAAATSFGQVADNFVTAYAPPESVQLYIATDVAEVPEVAATETSTPVADTTVVTETQYTMVKQRYGLFGRRTRWVRQAVSTVAEGVTRPARRALKLPRPRAACFGGRCGG